MRLSELMEAHRPLALHKPLTVSEQIRLTTVSVKSLVDTFDKTFAAERERGLRSMIEFQHRHVNALYKKLQSESFIAPAPVVPYLPHRHTRFPNGPVHIPNFQAEEELPPFEFLNKRKFGHHNWV